MLDSPSARFDIAGDLVGRNALLGFWRRLFQTYSVFELHILKCVADDDIVISESAYLLSERRGGVLDVRAIIRGRAGRHHALAGPCGFGGGAGVRERPMASAKQSAMVTGTSATTQ